MTFEDKVTDGEGTDGLVLGGKIVTDASLADQLGVHVKSVADCRRKLERWEYIQTRQSGKGYRVRVKKSKKWILLQTLRGSQSAPSEHDEGANPLHQKERGDSIRGSQSAPSDASLLFNDNPKTRQGLSLVTEELVRFWNENKGGLPEIKTFTKTRKAKLTTRLKENPNFLADLKTALIKARASKFLLSWRPSVDWFMEDDNNIVKVLEGKYDDGREKNGTAGTSRNNSGAGSSKGPFKPEAVSRPVPAGQNALTSPRGG